MNNVDCPQCGASVKAPENLAGKKARCSRCKDIFTVPELIVDLEPVEDASAAMGNPTGGEANLSMMEDVSPIVNEPSPITPTIDSIPAPTASPPRESEENDGNEVSTVVSEQVVDLEPVEVVDASPVDISSMPQKMPADSPSNGPIAEQGITSPRKSAFGQRARIKKTKIAKPHKRSRRGFLVGLLVGQLFVLGLTFGGEIFLDARPDLRFDIPVRGAVFVGITAGLALTGAVIGLFHAIEGFLYVVRPKDKPFGVALWNGCRRAGRALFSLGITLCVISGTAAANMPIKEWEPLGKRLWQYLTKASTSLTNTRGRSHDAMPTDHNDDRANPVDRPKEIPESEKTIDALLSERVGAYNMKRRTLASMERGANEARMAQIAEERKLLDLEKKELEQLDEKYRALTGRHWTETNDFPIR